VLTVDENGSSYALQLDPSQNFGGESFVLASDGFGGTDIFARVATLFSGQTLFVSSGQTDSGVTVLNGGTVIVLSGGTIVDTVVESGGSDIVNAGGLDVSATVAGTLTLFGTASGTTISSGGFEVISSGGVEQSATLLSGGTLAQFGGGTDNGLIWSAGTLEIGSGIATGRSVSTGQELDILSSGFVSSGTIGSGGVVVVSSGGLASDGDQQRRNRDRQCRRQR
jgi:fibronectin-binding autotransporter adhesin